LNSAVDYFRSIGAHLIIPGTTNAIFRTYPDGAIAAPYGTFLIDLTQPEETLWNNVHSKHRNVIRNAGKKGVRVISGLEHVDTAYNLVEETFKRSAMPFMSREAFKSMVDALGEQVRVFVADYQGTIQGAAVIPFSDFRAYYVYGGTNAEPLTGASNMLQWEAIKYFRSIGVKSYDFCGVRINPEKGSKQAGLMMFKERFGPKLVQGYMWKQSLAPLKSAVYSFGVRLLRGGDIVDREHHKLGGLETPVTAGASEAED
jgi:lipid II:glycine glycyltransferase (peptidoglycan interpeptide bridge formation enzyme)